MWRTSCCLRRTLKGRAEGDPRVVPGPPAQVAYWAGNSVAVLLAFYAGCIEGQLPDLKRRMEAQGDLPELPEEI
ncbi:hypothetical protein AB0H17_10060 [Streptomyces olivoreticuli]